MDEFTGEHNKEFFSKLYYNRSAISSPDQVQGMARAVIGFCKCFKNTEPQQQILTRLIREPIKLVLEFHKENFSEKDARRLMIQKTLPELDWVFYRDSKFPTKLNKQYFFDAERPDFNKKLFYYDLANILGLSKLTIDDVFCEVVSKNNFDLNFDVSAFSGKVNQVEAAGINEI